MGLHTEMATVIDKSLKDFAVIVAFLGESAHHVSDNLVNDWVTHIDGIAC